MDEVLKHLLADEGYHLLKEIPGRGICGVKDFLFTVAIVYGLDTMGYKGRYCYPIMKGKEAYLAFQIWDGVEDPVGPWIKHKGGVEYSNPNNHV